MSKHLASGVSSDRPSIDPLAESKKTSVACRAGVFGATGTTGVELVNLLTHHPGVDLCYITSRDCAGSSLSSIDPAAPDAKLIHPDEAMTIDADVAFLCLPHGAAAQRAEALNAKGIRVIDLSGDLRLKDPDLHNAAYGTPRNETLVKKVVYGLPEMARDQIRSANIVSNPGCYPTAVGLALLPLAENKILDGFVYVDAKSGVSGAGRAATPTTHFCSANEDVRPYKLGRVHRHVPEMEQTIKTAQSGKGCRVVFCPHLVPVERGILATCLVQGANIDATQAQNLYSERYAAEPFVKVLSTGNLARLRSAAHSNRAVIGFADVPECEALIITSAIDNLGKGAAGQAVQNMNLMFCQPESMGLRGF